MSTSKKIGGWIGVALGSIALIGSLWTAFQILDDLQDTDESLKASVADMRDGISELLEASVRYDSLTTANSRYRKRLICREAGYVPENCPILTREMGGEDLEPSEKAKLPEIP